MAILWAVLDGRVKIKSVFLIITGASVIRSILTDISLSKFSWLNSLSMGWVGASIGATLRCFEERYWSMDNFFSSAKGWDFLKMQTYCSVNRSEYPNLLLIVSKRPTAKSISLLS
mgnify:CR=1 FL=1